MRKIERIIVIAGSAVMIIAITMTVVFAMTNNAEPYGQAPLANAQAVEAPPAEEEAAPALGFGIRGLSDEQIDWILYAMDNGRLPDLNTEQVLGLMTVVRENFADGFMGGRFPVEHFDRMVLSMAGERGSPEDMKAALQEKAGGLLAQGLAEGMITQRLFDMLAAAIADGNIELTDDLKSELQVNLSALLALGLAEGKIPQEHYDMIVTAMENGAPELTEEQKAEMMVKLNGHLTKALAEGKISQEQFAMITSVMENGAPELTEEQKAEMIAELEAKAKAHLAKGLAEGKLSKVLYDAAISAMETRKVDFTPELMAELMVSANTVLAKCLAEERITQEQHDRVVTTIDTLVLQAAVRGFAQR